jgi:hypothetical protein
VGTGFRVILDRPIRMPSDFNDMEGDLELIQLNSNNCRLGNDYSAFYSSSIKKTTSNF